MEVSDIAGSFKVAKYHGASKDTVLFGVKRGEYEVGSHGCNARRSLRRMYSDMACYPTVSSDI
jgi:hypothetical protein